jgi:hypothetical protein
MKTKNSYWSHRIALEKLKREQKIWTLKVLARLLLLLVNLAACYLKRP